jgi:hypothetical protein
LRYKWDLFVSGLCFDSSVPIIQDAQANGFVAALKDNAEAKMGLLHAAYGKSNNLCRENP